MNRTLLLSLVACVGCAMTTEIQAQTVVSSPVLGSKNAGSIDFANAKPVPGRIVKTAPSTQVDAAALQKLSSGARGGSGNRCTRYRLWKIYSSPAGSPQGSYEGPSPSGCSAHRSNPFQPFA